MSKKYKDGLKRKDTYESKIGHVLNKPLILDLPPRAYMDVYDSYKYNGFQSHLDGLQEQQQKGQIALSNLLNNLSYEVNKNINNNFDERDVRLPESQKQLAKELYASFNNMKDAASIVKNVYNEEIRRRAQDNDRYNQNIDNVSLFGGSDTSLNEEQIALLTRSRPQETTEEEQIRTQNEYAQLALERQNNLERYYSPQEKELAKLAAQNILSNIYKKQLELGDITTETGDITTETIKETTELEPKPKRAPRRTRQEMDEARREQAALKLQKFFKKDKEREKEEDKQLERELIARAIVAAQKEEVKSSSSSSKLVAKPKGRPKKQQ